jgi:threonine dehydratase
VRSRGGHVVLHGESFPHALAHALALADQDGATFVPPFDDQDVIAGQGTVAMEILRQHPGQLDAIFVPVGGGGLIAGIAAYVKYLRPEIKVIGVEPDDSNCLQAAMAAGERVVLSQVGRDMNILNQLSAQMADYLMLDAEVVTNVYGNLMDEMMVTIVQGHAQRLGMKTIAGPCNQPIMMDTLSGIGIDFIYGDTIAEPQPLDLLLNTSYFAIN